MLRLTQVLQIRAYFPDSTTSSKRGSITQKINKAAFDHRSLVTNALQKVGINPGILVSEKTNGEAYKEKLQVPPAVLAHCSCDLHSSTEPPQILHDLPCRQKLLDALIQGVASTVMALLLCEAYSSYFQVAASIFNGTSTTMWCKHLSSPLSDLYAFASRPVTFKMLLGHLRRLVHGKATSESELPDSCLAVSAGAVTVAFKVLFDEEAFTDNGLIIALYPGRITADGEFREYVEDRSPHLEAVRDPILESWSIAEGVAFSPPSADGLVEIRSGFEMVEYGFKVSCNVYRSSKDIYLPARDSTTTPYPITNCVIQSSLVAFLQAPVGGPCGHSKDQPFVAPASLRLRAAHFCVDRRVPVLGGYDYVLIGTQGKKLRQLFAFASTHTTLVFRQGASCLPCAFDQACSIFGGKHHWKNVFIICE